MSKKCPLCDTINSNNAKYCRLCGKKFTEETPKTRHDLSCSHKKNDKLRKSIEYFLGVIGFILIVLFMFIDVFVDSDYKTEARIIIWIIMFSYIFISYFISEHIKRHNDTH